MMVLNESISCICRKFAIMCYSLKINSNTFTFMQTKPIIVVSMSLYNGEVVSEPC
jgi:hypothetical protein